MGNINCPVLGVKSGGVDTVIRVSNIIMQTCDIPENDAIENPTILQSVNLVVT